MTQENNEDFSMDMLKQKAYENFSQATVLEVKNGIVLMTRKQPQYMDTSRHYVVSHYNAHNNSFCWSTYDLNLEEAVACFKEKCGD